MKGKIYYYIIIIKDELIMLPKLISYLFTNKKKAIYVGCTGMGNLGDEAIYQAIKHYLSSDIFIYALPYDNVNAGKIGRRWFLKNPDLIILGGGTIIKKGPKESYLKIIQNQVELYPKAKTIILGPGVADANFAGSNGDIVDVLAWKLFLDKSTFVSVRGELSKKQLELWEVKNEIYILHDPVVYYAKHAILPKNKSKKIAINFAFIGNKIYGKNPKLIEEFANGIVQLLIENGWEIFLYPTTKSDLNYMQNVIGLKKHKEIKVYEDYINIDKSLSFIESMDVFLGQRLHSIIFAACVYTPFHAIEYEPKTSDFLITTGFENYLTRTDNLNINKAFHTIIELYNNIDKEQEKSFQLVSFAKQEQKKYIKEMLAKI